MKTVAQFLLTSLLTLTIINLNAQHKTIEFDFETKKFTAQSLKDLKSLKNGHTYDIKINNINLYRYGVKIESETFVDTSKYSLPVISSLGLESISSAFSAISPVNISGIFQTPPSSAADISGFITDSPSILPENYEGGLIMLLDEVSGTSIDYNSEEDLENLLNNAISEICDFIDEKEDHKKEIDDWLDIVNNHNYDNATKSFDIPAFNAAKPNKSALSDQQKLIKKSKSEYESLVRPFKELIKKEKYKVIHKKILDAYNKDLISAYDTYLKIVQPDNIQKLYAKIANKRITYESTVITSLAQSISNIPDNLSKQLNVIEHLELKMKSPHAKPGDFTSYVHDKRMKSLRKSFLDTRSNLKAEKKAIADAELEYKTEMSKLLQRAGENKELKTAFKDVESAYSLLKQETAKLETNLNNISLNKMYDRFLSISNTKDFTYTSMPFQFKGDEGWLKISFTPKSQTDNSPQYNPIKIHFPNEGSRISTTNLYYLSDLHDDIYSFRTEINTESNMSPDTMYRAIKEDTEEFEIGTGVLMSYDLVQSEDNVNFGLSFGPGVSFTNSVRLRVLTGIHVSYGSKHRIAFSGGFIFGYVDRVSSAVNTSETFEILPEQITVSKIRSGAYASLGYQFRFN